MANTTRPNISDAGVQKLEKYKAARIAEGMTGYELDEEMDIAYQYRLNYEKREKEEQERDIADKEMTNRKLDSKDENEISEYDLSHRFYMFKKAVTQAYKAITGNYPKKVDDYTFAKDMTDANPESASTIHDYLSGNNVSLKDVMRDLNLENSTNKYEVPESAGSIYHEVTSAGREGTEWNDRLADWMHLDTTSAYDAGDDFWGTYGKNLMKSLANVGTDTAGMVLNPADSLNGLKNMVAGGALYASKAIHDLINGESTMEEFLAKTKPEGWYDLPNQALNLWLDPEEAVQSVDAMKEYLIQRYGSPDAIANTLYEDPAGLIRDVKDILRGFKGAAKKTATGKKVIDAMDKYSPDNVIENTAIKGLNKTIEGVTDTSLDDVKNIPNKTKAALTKYVDEVGEQLGQLSKEEKDLIQNNPYAGEQLSKAIETFEKEGRTKTPEQIYDSMVREYVQKELVPKLDEIIDNVSEEGRVYGDVDKLKLKANNFQSEFETRLKNQGVKIGTNGKLDFTKAHTINENSEAINKIYNQLKEMSTRGEDITVAEYRDMRKLIGAEMTKAGKGTTTYGLLKNLMEGLNKDAHGQLSEFAQLDEVFNKNAEKAKVIKKGLVDNKGNIKPEALARESKRTGKTTGMTSEEQLEELLPGHKTKMEGLDITKSMLKKYKSGENIGKFSTIAGTAIGHTIGLLGWGGIGGVMGSGLGWLAGSKLGDYMINKRGKNWANTLGSVSEEGLNKLKEINDTIEKRGSITAADKAKIDDIIKSASATKAVQKAAAKAAKAAEKQSTKLEKQKALAEEANKRFKANYDKFRGVDEYSSLASKANSTSPFDNNQFDTWKSINQQFLNRKK